MACDKYDRILRQMFADPPKELKEFNEKHASTYSYVSKHIGNVRVPLNKPPTY